MVALRIDSNIRRFSRSLTKIERRQVPFATSVALNDTAFDVRKEIVERTFNKAFDVKNQRFIGAVLRVKKSTKRSLTATVFDRLGREYLVRHTTGGIKLPVGSNLAIPVDVPLRTSGGVTKSNRPRQMLNKKRHFVQRTKSGQLAILKRRGKKRLPLKVMYLLEPRARIRRTFRFFEDAERIVVTRFPRNFQKAWRKAIATARR